MTRTNARQLALQLSFAVSAGSDVGPDAFFDEDYFRALPAEDALFTEIPGEEERAYINALVTGVRDHREELDDLIEQFSHGWKLSRISTKVWSSFCRQSVRYTGRKSIRS